MELDLDRKKKPGHVTTGFLSKHIGTDAKYNENNTGIGYASPDGLLAGYYRNSNDKPSFYAGKEWRTDPYKLGPADLRAGLLAAAVTGYSKPLLPVLMPQLAAELGDHQMVLGYTPKVGNVNPATLALQYRKRL